MTYEFSDGWRAYKNGDALDLNWPYEKRSGWRQAEVSCRGTDKAMPAKTEIPRKKET